VQLARRPQPEAAEVLEVVAVRGDAQVAHAGDEQLDRDALLERRQPVARAAVLATSTPTPPGP
jgi:hypothetical protein